MIVTTSKSHAEHYKGYDLQVTVWVKAFEYTTPEQYHPERLEIRMHFDYTSIWVIKNVFQLTVQGSRDEVSTQSPDEYAQTLINAHIQTLREEVDKKAKG